MPPSRPRTPGIVYGGVAVVLVVLLAAFALTARQPAPPSIAEFAPQAAQRITESPDDQTSNRGAAAGEPTPMPSPEPASGSGAGLSVPRVRRCVGDPPRQIEDPQSPPCVPYWIGDNGGATSKGVTRDEVRIATASAIGTSTTDSNTATNVSAATIDALAAFFNRRFEFYGRHLNLLQPPGAGTANNEPGQRAQAVRADEEYHVFAATAYRNSGGQFYHEELARRGVVGAMGYEVTLTDEELRAKAPYLWSYLMVSDHMFTGIGTWVCARLAGRTALHGDPVARGAKRVFGVIMAPHPAQKFRQRPSLDPLTRALATCGEKPAYTANVDPGTASYLPSDPSVAQAHTDVMLKMRQAGVNSIICVCDWQYLENGGLSAATAQSYYPEWLLSSFGNMDHNITITLATSNQPQHVSHIFGLSFNPRQVSLDQEPYVNAIKEVDPALGADAQQHHSLRVYANQELYRSLLLIASGIQMAGPRLTPQTFAQALHNTRFPNPETPQRAGAVGFAGGSPSMTTDSAEWWWGSGATSPYPGDSGSMCYVDGGTRRPLTQYPSGDVFFTGSCDSGA